MTICKKIKKRISCLYLFLLFLIFFWFVSETISTITQLTPASRLENNIFSENLGIFRIKDYPVSNNYLPVKETPEGIVVKAKIREFSANAYYKTKNNIWNEKYHKIHIISEIFSLILLFSLFFIILRIIYLFIKGIKSENYFPPQNIIFTRIIGVLILFYALADSCSDAFNSLSFKHLFNNTEYSIGSNISFNYETLVFVLVLFILSEVFSIGTLLSNDNKMTI